MSDETQRVGRFASRRARVRSTTLIAKRRARFFAFRATGEKNALRVANAVGSAAPCAAAALLMFCVLSRSLSFSLRRATPLEEDEEEARALSIQDDVRRRRRPPALDARRVPERRERSTQHVPGCLARKGREFYSECGTIELTPRIEARLCWRASRRLSAVRDETQASGASTSPAQPAREHYRGKKSRFPRGRIARVLPPPLCAVVVVNGGGETPGRAAAPLPPLRTHSASRSRRARRARSGTHPKDIESPAGGPSSPERDRKRVAPRPQVRRDRRSARLRRGEHRLSLRALRSKGAKTQKTAHPLSSA